MTPNKNGLFGDGAKPVPLPQLLAWSAGTIGFGFALGTYAGLGEAFLAAWKLPLVVLLTVLITLPSLAVLIPLTGGELSLRRAVDIALSTTAYLGALLLALAPVMWLFAASSWYLAWSVVVCVGLVLVSLLVAGYRVATHFATVRRALILWMLLLIPVSLQMATTLRPIVTPKAPAGPQRMFFLQHFGEIAEFRLQKSGGG